MNEARAVSDCIERQIEAAVAPLCERYGYGAVMSTAGRLWQERDALGAIPYDSTAPLLRRAIEDALIHYRIGDDTERFAWEALEAGGARGALVDWRHVASRMAADLEDAAG